MITMVSTCRLNQLWCLLHLEVSHDENCVYQYVQTANKLINNFRTACKLKPDPLIPASLFKATKTTLPRTNS